MQKPSRKQRRTAPGNEPAVREEDARRKKVPPAVKQTRARRHLSDSDVLSAPSPEAQRIDAELAGLEAWMARPAVSGNGPFGLPGGVPGRTEVYKGPVACSCLQRRRYPRSRPGGVPMAKFRIENVVASTSLGHELDLKAIALALGGSEYEPEQFPGLVYRIDEPKVVLLMFGSGKVVCTGARKPADVEKAVEKITAELKANGLLH